MFGQTHLFAIVAAVLVCSATTFATEIILQADFTERNPTNLPNSSITGKLYYFYDSSTNTNSRLRYVYNVPGVGEVSNLYHYEHEAIYSMCPGSCTGLIMKERADPWYFDSNVYTKGSSESGLYWFTRKALASDSKVTKQVNRILMSDSTSQTANIKKIEFADGRVLTLSNVVVNPSGLSKSDAKFSPDAGLNCPKATCPIYADMVFVLDNSGSVDSGEWKKTADFVNAVMDSFTFGDDAVEAAIIQFNAYYYSKSCPTKYVDGCSLCSGDYTFQSSAFPGDYTATITAGTDQGSGVTVWNNVKELKRIMSGNRPNKYGNTCQGYGLELAMKVFDRSPRTSYSRKPNRIVIAVTDGIDMCPNRTADAAAKLKKKQSEGGYDATVVEIGVGMSSSCNNYYKRFLQRISSTLGTEPAYFDVNNYDAIKQVAEKLFKPICDGFNTQCGPDCHGFCGCGKCYCPTCDTFKDSCNKVECKTDSAHKTSTGCATSAIPCPVKDNVCRQWKCNGNVEGDGRCTPVDNDCATMKNQYPGTCRVVKCDPSKTTDNGCYVQLNHTYCQKAFGNMCEEFECSPDKGSISGYAASGCRLKSNKTQELQDQLKSSGKDKCFKAVCNKNTGVTTEADTCVSTRPNCATSTCTKSGSSYSCKETEVNNPTNDCTTYTCEKSGWTVKSQKTVDQCISELGGSDKVKCKNVYCKPQGGCKADDMDGCESECSATQITNCLAEGDNLGNNSIGKCIMGTCIVIHDAGQSYHLGCKFDKYTNCYQTMAAEVEKLNKANPDKCYTPACNKGQCGYDFTDIPYDSTHPKTECMKYECQKQGDGSWEWKYVPTEVNNTCLSDECSTRVCDPDQGCVETDICMVKTTECDSYSCDASGGNGKGKCVRTDLRPTFIKTECTEEVCQDGKKVLTQLNLTIACANPNKCLVPDCVEGKCVFHDKEPEDRDLCLDYTCIPTTGEFETKPHCDDGLYCTENQCTVTGECKYPQIICTEEELPMDGYPCFVAKCKEGDGEYNCVRKLRQNAYIDVCGNCIQEKEDTTVNSGSISGSESESSVDLLECTNAPPKPLLTEGLAAAAIALIILAAVLVGAGIAASGVLGTKTLIDRAKGAKNQSAHTNPLFEGNEAEMTNPAFVGEQ